MLVSDGKVAALPGGVVIYALAYANLGTAAMNNVKITETVPSNARFVLAQSLTGWNCPDASGPNSTCVFNVGTLAAGARGIATFAVLHNGSTAPVAITNTARIGGAGVDANSANNVSTATTPLILSGGSAISPVLECVIDRGSGVNPRYTAVFGYNNTNAFAKAIGIGSANKFSPNPQDRKQPTLFLPGRQRNVFFAEFNSGNLVWTLNGKTSTASASSARCSASTQVVSGVAWLDSNGNGLRGSVLSEPPLPLVVVNVVNANGSVLDTRLTQPNGSYTFILDNPDGMFVQALKPLPSLAFTTKNANGGGNDTNDSAIDPATWQTTNLGAMPNPLRNTINIGLRLHN